MATVDRLYDRPITCPKCRVKEGPATEDRILGSVKRGPDNADLLCGPCWADTRPGRQGPPRTPMGALR